MEKNIFMELLAAREFKAIRSILNVMNAVDIASLLSEFEEKELAQAFRLIPKAKAAEVFANMSNATQSCPIDAFTETELKEIIDDMFMDDTVDLLEDLPANVVTRILSNINPQKRAQINILLDYPQDSAGSIMTTEYIDLKKDMTVDEAFDRIRKIGIDTETIYSCYVISNRRRLIGTVSLKDLLLNDKGCVIGDLMDENVISANTVDDKEEVAQTFDKYDILALPVVDKEGRLVGIITVDDVIDVIQEEATEDIEKMAAILPSEHSYFKTSVFNTFKARIPWLLLLMISATFTGSIISGFEGKIAIFPALVAFIPMLMDTGGNSGGQASVTIIRSISMGDIEFKDIFKVIWKEIRVAFLCAATLAFVSALKLFLIDNLLFNNLDAGKAVVEIFVVCATLFCTVIVAKLIGCILPILAKKIGFDPAVMASPLITTIVDAVSLLIYFGIASAILL